MKTRCSVLLFCVRMIFTLVFVFMGSMAFGQTVQWSSPMQVSDDPSRSEYAHMVIDSQDNQHIFWMEPHWEAAIGIPISIIQNWMHRVMY
jgi:hypothetical protein